MSQDFTPAAESVLLDYLSMWNVAALFRSLRRGHFIVALTICASLLIKLMTALSTGLFISKDVDLVFNAEFQVQSKFDGTAYNQSAVNSQVYFKSWGVAHHNLSNPLGTMEGHAFQNFYKKNNDSK